MSDDRRIPTAAGADRPTFTILSGGAAVSEEYQVLSVNVKRAVNRVTAATIILLDGDPSREDVPISNADDFKPGQEIEIQAGYHREEEVLFKGIVIRQSIRSFKNKPSILRIECRDKAAKLTVARKNKYFYEVKDSDVLEEIINSAGLTPDVESTNPQHQEMVQFNSTDWDFLVSRAESNGKLVFTEDGTLRVAAPDLGQSPGLTLRYGGNIIDFEVEMEARYQFEGVNAYAWDAANQELTEVEANAPSGTLPGNIDAGELAGVIGLGAYELRHAGQVKDAELQGWADAQLLKSRLAKIRGRVRIQGFGALRPGQIVEIAGAGDRFNGPIYVSGVQHDINDRNWETQLEIGLSPQWFHQEYADMTPQPAHGLLPTVNGLHIGLVTALEGDPDGEDRVQVRIPMINASEDGVWARVASLDAGENRGAFFRPEIGDEVILGFLDDDPRHPVVLGMLNSSAKPAPISATDDNHEKGFVTRSEMKVIFNDDEISFTVQTPNGNKLVLSDQDGGITLEDENGNKIVLNADGIKIESAGDIQFSASSGDVKAEATNITHSANANFKAEGSGGAEISSSGSTVVKGSIVQIN